MKALVFGWKRVWAAGGDRGREGAVKRRILSFTLAAPPVAGERVDIAIDGSDMSEE